MSPALPWEEWRARGLAALDPGHYLPADRGGRKRVQIEHMAAQSARIFGVAKNAARRRF